MTWIPSWCSLTLPLAVSVRVPRLVLPSPIAMAPGLRWFTLPIVTRVTTSWRAQWMTTTSIMPYCTSTDDVVIQCEYVIDHEPLGGFDLRAAHFFAHFLPYLIPNSSACACAFLRCSFQKSDMLSFQCCSLTTRNMV